MTTETKSPDIYPTLSYRDAPTVLAFLDRAFGIEVDERHDNDDGTVAHAVLGWGSGVIMASSTMAGSSPFDMGPQCIYLATDDPDGLHDRAVAAGAEIVMGLTDQDYGSREFAARDPEGNVWCFGTYRIGRSAS